VSTAVIVQYLGFQAKPLSREYTFNVRGGGEEREYTLNIANEAFVSHRASYQDAPVFVRRGYRPNWLHTRIIPRKHNT
jgi:hypothetical protein